MTTHAVATARRARYAPSRRYRAARRLLGAAVSAAVLLAAWWAFAPPALGGSAAFAVVDGTSMLPHFRRGDLVVLRRADRYGVGDVVAYRSPLLHRIVLHRIVAVHAGRYTFKGDNNSFIDPEAPTRRELIAKVWLRVPRAGAVSSLLRKPAIGAALTALLVLGVGLGGAKRDDRQA